MESKMGRYRSFIKNITVDNAIKSHDCAHDAKHRLSPGDKRLKLKIDRSSKYFCADCAVKFIDVDISNLKKIKALLKIEDI